MKCLTVIYFCVSILPSIVSAHHEAENIPDYETVKQIDNMFNSGKLINNIFEPSKMGFLGAGTAGFTYKGTLEPTKPSKRMVAMKFSSNDYKIEAKSEYEIYSNLNAINDTYIERMGIPSVYYFGKWNGYTLLAITLLDSTFNKKLYANDILKTDVLIICREFVKATKYIHSRRIYHKDIRIDNIMFRNNEGFIIDYNLASKMYKNSRAKTSNPSTKETLDDGRRYAKKDWGSFLCSMSGLFNLKLQWLEFHKMHAILDGREKILSQRIAQNIQQIEGFKNGGLNRVFAEFAKYVFAEQIPNDSQNNDEGNSIYDHLYEVICEEIAKYEKNGPVLVSWLTDRERHQIIQSLQQHPKPTDIKFIDDPFTGPMPIYDEVNYEYFSNNNNGQFSGESSVNSRKIR